MRGFSYLALKISRYLFILVPWIIIIGCYPLTKKEIKEPERVLVPIKHSWPQFKDDLDLESLEAAVKQSLQYFQRLDPARTFIYGPDRFSCRHIISSLESFLTIISATPNIRDINRELKKNFLLYRAGGKKGDKNVLFTGYYEPILEGSLAPAEQYPYPLYTKPQDLLKIDLSAFNPKYAGESVTARLDGGSIVPYYTRRNIDEEMALTGKKLEIAWLKDPVDIAFLQIQGSGRIKLPGGETVNVGYAASNGRPYRSLGRFMMEKGLIKKKDLSMQTIRKYLHEHPDTRQEILNHNSSYVFFRILDNGPLGCINVPLTPGRSLALDSRLFPKGGLAYIKCKKPVIAKNGKIIGWKDFSRFVLNQDTGGAIKGGGRADLFWGNGRYAEIAAGNLQHEGELYFLVKKEKSPRIRINRNLQN